jgi:hypothetical protein
VKTRSIKSHTSFAVARFNEGKPGFEFVSTGKHRAVAEIMRGNPFRQGFTCVIAVAFAALLSATASHAASLWDHNGSTVSLEASGAARKFYYDTPRPGLPVAQGTLLFSGRKEGDRYSGMAYLFSAKCGARGYLVSGPVAADQRSITMHGKAPRFDSNCGVIDYRDDVLVFTYRNEESISSNKIAITIGKDASTFHYEYHGRTIYVDVTPEVGTDHDWFLYEDLVKADPRLKLPIIFGRTAGINNAFATIYHGTVPWLVGRRLIVTDPAWLGGHNQSPIRFLVFAHEIGHQICGHRGTFVNDTPRNWTQELEADLISGIALRTYVQWGYARFEDVIASAYNRYSDTVGSPSHPPQAQRIAAITEGYRTGVSPCFGRNVALPTDPTPEEEKQADRERKQFFRQLAVLYGTDMRWSFKHWTYGDVSLQSKIDGNKIKIVIDRPNAKYQSAGAHQGSIFFEGISDDDKVQGTLYHYAAGCDPIAYEIDSALFFGSTALALRAKPPSQLSNCTVVNYYHDTLHILKLEH